MRPEQSGPTTPHAAALKVWKLRGSGERCRWEARVPRRPPGTANLYSTVARKSIPSILGHLGCTPRWKGHANEPNLALANRYPREGNALQTLMIPSVCV